jgi:hypothetical protein
MGQKKSAFINEIGHLVKTALDEHFRKKMGMTNKHFNHLANPLKTFF